MRRNTNDPAAIAGQFAITEGIVSCKPYGDGHINETYLITTASLRKYILQALNTYVFPHPDEVMENIEKVTSFLAQRTDDPRKVLHFLKTREGSDHVLSEDGRYFRMMEFVPDSVCPARPYTSAVFRECARAFGQFQKQLNDFDAASLHETIPDFHNTPKRFENLMKAVHEDRMKRASSAEEELRFAMAHKDFCSVLLDAHTEGILPLRVSHNDTKCDNVLLDADTARALCVIDLDTVMPGFSVTDFGDAVRFGACTAAEDEKDVSRVGLNMDMYNAYAEGFLEECGSILRREEIMLMPEGAMMMTLENGMRFLTDYLEGDVYYRTAYPDHNLVRCRTQFRLVTEMEKNWNEMKNTVRRYCSAGGIE